MSKRIAVFIAVALLLAAVFAVNFLRDVQAIASGYVSHTLCTNVLMLGRDQADVEANDLTYLQNRVNTSLVQQDRVISTAQIGPISYTSTSVLRPGLGCSNVGRWPVEDVLAVGLAEEPSKTFPERIFDTHRVDNPALEKVLAGAFIEKSDDVYQRKNTRAVIVHHKGKLIAERYAPGFDRNTPLRSMSMTKSATSALIGILVKQGRLDIHQPAPISEWVGLEEYADITTHHLLTMTAGFDYNEAYESDPRNLLNTMLMTQENMPAYAANTPLLGKTGKYWDYQTTHSVLLQEVIRNVIADDEEYFQFPQEVLFSKLGMRNSFFQADASGTFIGGAFMYASARDWLSLGLLYLNDGVHDGERMLPEGWVEYSLTPSAPSLEKRAYGAQIWLNAQSPHQLFPDLPEDSFAFQGHYGQYVIVIPSLQLLVVRMGMSFEGEKVFNKQAFINQIVAALR